MGEKVQTTDLFLHGTQGAPGPQGKGVPSRAPGSLALGPLGLHMVRGLSRCKVDVQNTILHML